MLTGPALRLLCSAHTPAAALLRVPRQNSAHASLTARASCRPPPLGRLTKKQLSAWVHVAPPGQYEEIWFRGGHT